MQSAMSVSDPTSCRILGYRFNPTDLELVTHYLSKKINNEYVSPSLIPTCDNMYTTDPRNLPIDEFKHGFRNEAYYFVLRQNIGTRGKRQTKAGTWKAGGIDKPIIDGRGIEVGHVLQLSYHYDGAKGSSGWIMHEYRLSSKEHKKGQKTSQEWVLCKIKRPSGINKSDRVGGDFNRVISKFEVGESSSTAITRAYGHDQDIRMGEAQVKEETEAAAAAVTGDAPCTSTGSQEVETWNPDTILPSSSYMDTTLESLFTEQAPSSQNFIVPEITAASKESPCHHSYDGKGCQPASGGAGVLPPLDKSLPSNILIHPYLSWDTPKVEYAEGEEEDVGYFNTPHLFFLYDGLSPETIRSCLKKKNR